MSGKSKLIVVLCILAILVISSCQPPRQNIEDDVRAIKALVKAWVTAVESGDVEQILTLYTDDIVEMPPNAPANKGKRAVEDYFNKGLEAFTIEATWPVEGTEEIIVSGNLACYISEYQQKFTLKANGAVMEDHGKIVEICLKQPDGSWKFAREIWNSNNPIGNE